MPINAGADSYVLKGRIVTMDDKGVIDDGCIYIQNSMIVAVTEAFAPAPDGFDDAIQISTGDTIYPGMIELHNHLSYNAIPLWDVPKRYAHNGSWRGTAESKRAVNKPAQVLANTDGIVEAIVRFVECRCLLGGVTTSQGITLSTASGIVSFYDGLVRNVERPNHPNLARVGTSIADPPKDPRAYLEKLKNNSCYLQHLSEGFGVTPRERFTRLQLPDGTWAINNALCGIHSTALNSDDFKILAERGGTMIWSPLSNLLLYGQTADIAAAKAADLPIALGSDWGPSGSKNLLGELKVARLVSDEKGGLFTDKELVEMTTSTPARICRWDNLLGTISPGKLADLVLLNGRTGDPYTKLVEARETTVSMVIIDGIPRVGQPSLMGKFADGTERIKVGKSERILNLAPQPGDDILENITLSEATERLRNALENLPQLAEEIDAAIESGFDGSAGSTGSWINANIAPRLRLMLDFENDDAKVSENLALGAGDLADWVDSMVLDEITVADDPEFLRKIVRQRNLPRYIVEGLPKLHGKPISIPQSASFLKDGKKFVSELLDTEELGEFLKTPGLLSLDDRRTILEQAILLIRDYYVHLPMKRSKYGIDPVQRLLVMQYALKQQGEEDTLSLTSELDFHQELIDVFNSLRDLHTVYRLPRPYRGKVAWLPFLIEEATENNNRMFLISHVVGNAGPETFIPGVVVQYWNGIPMEALVRKLAREMPCGNPAARRARSLNSLTQRLLTRGQFPDENWVTLQYLDINGVEQSYTQPWLVFEPSADHRSLSALELKSESLSLGVDDHVDDLHEAKKALFASDRLLFEREGFVESSADVENNTDGTIPTNMPTVFRVQKILSGEKEYGYLRIFSFQIDDSDEFVAEIERILIKLQSTAGLIIDLRGNSGGLILAAEQTLELFSPISIRPQSAQFVSTPATMALCEAYDGTSRVSGLDLKPWVESINRSVVSGAEFSAAVPLTSEKDCNRRGQVYQAPVVLVVDGLCYSATDMFIAGFQDHGLGRIIGIDGNTGAGGANVWSHSLLRRLTTKTGSSRLRSLPKGADMRVAIRRLLRVGNHGVEILEDFGIKPDFVYKMTRKDVLEGNTDLIENAIGILREMPAFVLRAEIGPDCILIRSKGIEYIDLAIDSRKLRSHVIQGDVTTILGNEIKDILNSFEDKQESAMLEVIGFQNNNQVVRTQCAIDRTKYF